MEEKRILNYLKLMESNSNFGLLLSIFLTLIIASLSLKANPQFTLIILICGLLILFSNRVTLLVNKYLMGYFNWTKDLGNFSLILILLLLAIYLITFLY